MPSLTNRVFRLTGAGGDFVLRLGNTAPYLDRTREARNHRLAAAIDLAPALVYAEADLLVTKFVEDAVRFDRCADRRAAIAAVACGFRKLHNADVAFEGEMRLIPTLDLYLDIAGDTGTRVASAWRHWRKRIAPTIAYIEATLVPSHVDPVPDNILLFDRGDRLAVRFIDWEYAAPAAAVWDLADFAIEADLSKSEEAELLTGYAGEQASAIMPAFRLYEALLDLLAAAWAASQMSLVSSASGHAGMVEARLARATEAFGRPEFERALAAVEQSGVKPAVNGH